MAHMEHTPKITEEKNNHHFGLHYFIDAERYSDTDANLWAARLREIGAEWIVLKNPENRAIPESFIQTFTKNGLNIIGLYIQSLTQRCT